MTSREQVEAYNGIRHRCFVETEWHYPDCKCLGCELAALPPLPVPPDVPEVGSRWVSKTYPTIVKVCVGSVDMDTVEWHGSGNYGECGVLSFLDQFRPAPSDTEAE